MRVYVSGKITGLPYPEALQMFDKAVKKITQQWPEVEVISPVLIDHGKANAMLAENEAYKMNPENDQRSLPHSERDLWCQYMKEDIAALLKCTGVYMLTNWVHSEGARIEHAIAKEMGLVINYEQ